MTSIRQTISPKRQNDDAQWRVLAKRHEPGSVLPEHKHQTGQLVFALCGVMLVRTGSMLWSVPPQRALWIPAGHLHTIEMLSPVELRTVYFQPGLIAEGEGFERKSEVHAVVASPLLKELIAGLFDLRNAPDALGLMAQLLLRTLRQTSLLPSYLPMPKNQRLHGALTKLLVDNDWHWTAQEIAIHAAMSERTFSRHFNAEVGLSFRVWRQRARIIASFDMLAANSSIKSIANAMQFATPAAYVAAFRKLIGCAPNAFRREDHGMLAGRPTDQKKVLTAPRTL